VSVTSDPHAGQPVVTAGVPLETARAAMILVHGRNAAPRNILELATPLAHPGVAYLAPAAADHTWYPLSFLAERPRNEPWLSSALGVIRRLVDDVLARGIPPSRIVLLGFSQGACLAAEFALRHPTRYGGLVVFSGGLIGPPGTTWEERGDVAGTPVLFGCSDVDAHVPRWRVDESAAVFTRMGASTDLRIYPGMGHLVNDDEIAAARAIVAAAAG
jgi:phospholipase/carboxylesterase